MTGGIFEGEGLITLIVAVLTLLINAYQSWPRRLFVSDCCGKIKITSDSRDFSGSDASVDISEVLAQVVELKKKLDQISTRELEAAAV